MSVPKTWWMPALALIAIGGCFIAITPAVQQAQRAARRATFT